MNDLSVEEPDTVISRREDVTPRGSENTGLVGEDGGLVILRRKGDIFRYVDLSLIFMYLGAVTDFHLPVAEVPQALSVCSCHHDLHIDGESKDMNALPEGENLRHAPITGLRVLRRTTGKICRTPPPITTILPPRASLCPGHRCFHATALWTYRCSIGASSQTMSSVRWRISARPLYMSTKHAPTRSTIGGGRGCNRFVPVLGGNGTKTASYRGQI